MFQTWPLTSAFNAYGHPSLTSMVMMVSCKASLNKAAYQAAELPGNISGSPKVRAELIAKWRLLSPWSLRTDESVYVDHNGNVFISS